MFHDELGKEQDQQNLGKLRGLKCCESQINPSSCTVHLIPKRDNGGKNRHGKQIEQPVKIADPHIINEGYDKHHTEPKGNAEDLSRLVDCFCASHSHNPNHGQRQHKEHQAEFIIS